MTIVRKPWLSDDRKNKNLAREKVFSCGPKKSILLLPGYRCECVKEALQKGVITKDTVCTFVERDLETACQIKQWVYDEWKFPIPPIVHMGELMTLKMHPIDLAYIDLFGNLTKAEVEWIQNELIPNLMPGSDLFFTFSVPIRGNEFMRRALNTMNTKYNSMFNDRMDKVKNIKKEAREVAALYDVIFERMFVDHSYNTEFWTYRDRGPFTMLLMTLKSIKQSPALLKRRIYERESFGATAS